MHNVDIVAKADALMRNIASNAHLKREYLDAVADRLTMPAGFPPVVVVPHDDRAWATVQTPFELADVDPDKIPRVIVNQVAIDLSDLLANGDTSSEDHFLALFDGLRKRTTWPNAFVLSDRAAVEVEAKGTELTWIITLHVAVDE